MVINSTNTNQTNNHCSSYLNPLNRKKDHVIRHRKFRPWSGTGTQMWKLFLLFIMRFQQSYWD